MAWQHIGLRIWGSLYFQQKIILPQFMGKETNQELVKVAVGGIKKSLRELETIWLKDNPYVAGKEISVADLMAVTELEQPGMILNRSMIPIGDFVSIHANANKNVHTFVDILRNSWI